MFSMTEKMVCMLKLDILKIKNVKWEAPTRMFSILPKTAQDFCPSQRREQSPFGWYTSAFLQEVALAPLHFLYTFKFQSKQFLPNLNPKGIPQDTELLLWEIFSLAANHMDLPTVWGVGGTSAR